MTLSESEIRVFALPKVIKEKSIGGENTYLYSDRDKIQTGRESQTEDLAEKTEERAAGSLSFVQLGRTLTQEGVEV